MTIPLYLKIKQDILEQIHSGKLKIHDRVPSENQLARQFSVSRLTVQRALRELVSEGYLRRAQGSGTFVTPSVHRFALIEVRDVVEEIRRMGGEPHSEVLLQRRLVPEAEVQDLLDLAADEDIFHAAIIQRMDGVPVAFEERFAVPDVFPDFLEQDFSRRTVFDYFASRSELEEIENEVGAIKPSARIARDLEIALDEPCLRISRRNWYRGQCITLTRITYAGARQVLSSRYRPSRGKAQGQAPLSARFATEPA